MKKLAWMAAALLMVGCAGDESGSAGGAGGGDPDVGQIGDAAAEDSGAAKDVATGADSGGKAEDSGSAVEDAGTAGKDAGLTTKDAGATTKDTGTTATDAGPSGDFTWFSTCGDPVCKQGGWKDKGLPLCSKSEAKGAKCDPKGAKCDPKDDCNSTLLCSDKDPKAGPGGCPISQRAAKRDIRYLSPTDEGRYAAELAAMKLATWRYKGGDGSTKLGFIIDDTPASVAVDGRGDRVDLYSYTSLAIAALKQQQRQISELRAEIAALKAARRVCR